jgi:phospholipase B1
LGFEVFDALNSTECVELHKLLCPCAISKEYRSTLLQMTQNMNDGLENLIKSGAYDRSDDFTVVYQPFMKKAQVLRLENGGPDYSYFAVDCFHFSAKGNSIEYDLKVKFNFLKIRIRI